MIVTMAEGENQHREEVIRDALNASSEHDGMNPEHLLENLSPMLCEKGGIKSDDDVQDLTELMKETDKLVGRCVYMNIIKATHKSELLEKFIESGGWEVLNDWLQDAKNSENGPFLMELMEVYSNMPVTVGLLKKTNCAKSIKQVSKSADSQELKKKAAGVVEKWMQKIREKAPDSSSKDSDKGERSKKKKKQKEASPKESSTKKEKEPGKSPQKEKEVVKEDDDASMDSNDSKTSDTKPSAPKEPVKPKAKTVKTVPNKMRSTGLLDEEILPAKKKGSGDKAVKRISPTVKANEPPEKRPRPTLASLNATSTPSSSTSPREKGETKIKLIAPRPAPPIESTGFMDALNNTNHMPVRKKRRPSSNTPDKITGKTPTSPTSPSSKQPVVPSFYKDTLESNNEESNSTEASEGNENSTNNDNDVEMKSDETKSEEGSSGGGMVRKKHKKKVSWVEEAYLCQFHYFEMNENERVNVNKLRDMEEMKKQEKLMERQALKGMGRGMDDDDFEWRRPSLITGITPAVTAGCNSLEKDTQRQREQGVLQALYFSKDMIPDSATEADPESIGHQDAITIPLDDENGPVESGTPPAYPAPVYELPKTKKQQQQQQQQQQQSNFSLPPNVANMIANMAQEQQMKSSMNNTANNVSSSASTLAHLDPHMQTMIKTILENGNNLSFEQFSSISPDKLVEILKPFEHQLGGFNLGEINNGMQQQQQPQQQQMMHGGQGVPMGGNYMMNQGGPGYMNGPMGPGMMGGPHMMGGPGPMMGGNDGPMMGGPNMMGGPGMRFRGGPPNFRGGPPRGRGPNGPRGMPPVCRNFASGKCRFGNSCKFLHPGVNGPPL